MNECTRPESYFCHAQQMSSAGSKLGLRTKSSKSSLLSWSNTEHFRLSCSSPQRATSSGRCSSEFHRNNVWLASGCHVRETKKPNDSKGFTDLEWQRSVSREMPLFRHISILPSNHSLRDPPNEGVHRTVIRIIEDVVNRQERLDCIVDIIQLRHSSRCHSYHRRQRSSRS